MVPMASVSGTTKSSNSSKDMTRTARLRRCQSRASTHFMTGQVETTSMVAQMAAPRKGRRIQNDAAIRAPRNSTPSVILTRSAEGFSCMGTGSGTVFMKVSQV